MIAATVSWRAQSRCSSTARGTGHESGSFSAKWTRPTIVAVTVRSCHLILVICDPG